MKAMVYKGYAARVEFDAEDAVFAGRIAGISDVVGFHAMSVPELIAAFHEAVDCYLETCARIGKEPQRAYSGNLMLRITSDTHAAAASAADALGKSLNQWSEEVLAEAAKRVVGGGAT
jgi:predicted HicB family RNase H-like nuclease